MRLVALALATASLAFVACFVRPDDVAIAADGGAADGAASGALGDDATPGAGPATQGGGSDAAVSAECIGYDSNAAARLADAGGTFLATGVGQRTTFSLDGVHWNDNESVPYVPDAAPGQGDIQATAQGNGILVAAASTGLMTSVDGLTWTAQTVAETKPYVHYDNGFSAVAFGKGVFVASGAPQFNALAFFHSTDGITWPTPAVVGEEQCCRSLNAITFADDKFVAVGGGRRTVVSDDGIAWRDDKRASEDGSLIYTAVAFGNGTWVTVGTHSLLAWSANGSDWTDAADPNIIGDFHNLVFDGSKFLTCARLACYTSTDGKAWTQAAGTISDPRPSVALVFKDGVYVGLDTPATLLTSPDGVAWTPVYCGESPALTSLSFIPR